MKKIIIIGYKGNIGQTLSAELTGEYDVIGFDLDQGMGDLEKIIQEKTPIEHIVFSASAPIQLKEVAKEDADVFDAHFSSQVKVLVNFVNRLLPLNSLRSILVIGSNCLFGQPPQRMASYTTAKYALLGLTKSYALELAPKGIRVNMISPGLTGEGASRAFPAKLVEITEMQTPMRRLVKGKDIANLAKFLMSEDSAYITGVNIPLDGGLHMN